MAYTARLKRLVIGRAIRTEQGQQQFGRARAVASMASDALSSNVYATQEILVILAVGGFGLYRFGPAVAALVVVVFAVVVAAYRHTVRQYPGGGADYTVAARNLGSRPAAVVGAAMLIDFALTLAVSVAAMLDTMISLVPTMAQDRVLWAIGLVALMTLLSLRGRSGLETLLHLGTYAFVLAIIGMAGVAAVRVLLGDTPRAASADYELVDSGASAVGLALVLILARAFSSGSIAVTGVEAIGTGAPLFSKPRGENAAGALLVLGVVSMVLFVSITWMALLTGVRATARSSDLAGAAGESPQQMVVVQIADAVLGGAAGVAVVAGATILILVAAGLSAFRSFTTLSSVIAHDGLLPRQFTARGDRFVYSNGILLLGIAAGLLTWVLGASLTALIQLYVVGAFLALALGQIGMVRHWNRVLSSSQGRRHRASAVRGRAVAAVAAAVAAVVFVVVLLSKLAGGAWVVVLVIPLLALGMLAVRRHYDSVVYETAPEEALPELPTHEVTALILVARIHKPTLRAIAYARATRPSIIEAVTVAVDEQDADELARKWQEHGMPVPLKVLDSPFREIDSPVLAYVAQLRRSQPDSLLTVYIPEYVVTHWWEELLHNQSAARLKRRLMSLSNVVVMSVPWQTAATRAEPPTPGAEPPLPRGGVTGTTGAIPRVRPAEPPRDAPR